MSSKSLTVKSLRGFPRLPFTRGNPNAKIAIIGEAPGSEEQKAYSAGQSATAFVGKSGQELDRMLNHAGIILPNEECYFTNVVKRRPPDNKIASVLRDEVEQSISNLHRELSLLPNLTVVVPVGNLALHALTDVNTVHWSGNRIKKLAGITHYRGSILPTLPLGASSKVLKCIPTFHPAAVMRMWSMRVTAVADLERVVQDSAFPELRLPEYNLHLRPTSSNVKEFLRAAMQERRVVTDIENYPLCVGIAISRNEAMCIPFQNGDGSPYWNPDDEAEIHKSLYHFFSNHQGQCCHFGYHDIYCYHHYGWLEGLIRRFINLADDTFSQHVCMYGELPHALHYLTSIYTRQRYYKEEGRKFDPRTDPIEQFWNYNGLDCVVTYECMEELTKELHELGLFDFYVSNYIELFPHLMQTMLRGIRVDEGKRTKAREGYVRKWRDAQDLLQSVINKPIDLDIDVDNPIDDWKRIEGYFNVKSNPQVYSFITDRLRVPIKNTNEKLLRRAAIKHEHARPFIKAILDVREIRDIYSRYLRPKLGHDGRYHFTLKASTETGRLASSKDPLGYGNNAQNIPDGLCRSYFVPDPGKVFLYSDLSQAEARIVAYISNCARMIAEFVAADKAAELGTICICGSGKLFSKCCGDSHRLSASNIFNKPVHLITNDERALGKMGKHASNYKVGARTLSLSTGLPESVCRIILAKIHHAYPELSIWHNHVRQELLNKRYLVNPFGRVRFFFDHPLSSDTLKEALAFIPQSTIPDLVNQAYKEISSAGIQVLNQVHDALLTQVYVQEVEDAVKYIEEALTIPVPISDEIKIIIPIDTKVGMSWSHDDLVSPEEFLMSGAPVN